MVQLPWCHPLFPTSTSSNRYGRHCSLSRAFGSFPVAETTESDGRSRKISDRTSSKSHSLCLVNHPLNFYRCLLVFRASSTIISHCRRSFPSSPIRSPGSTEQSRTMTTSPAYPQTSYTTLRLTRTEYCSRKHQRRQRRQVWNGQSRGRSMSVTHYLAPTTDHHTSHWDAFQLD